MHPYSVLLASTLPFRTSETSCSSTPITAVSSISRIFFIVHLFLVLSSALNPSNASLLRRLAPRNVASTSRSPLCISASVQASASAFSEYRTPYHLVLTEHSSVVEPLQTRLSRVLATKIKPFANISRTGCPEKGSRDPTTTCSSALFSTPSSAQTSI